MDYIKYVKCYDTLKKEYVSVPVTVEMEQVIKRSYWREDMQERRYYKRKVELDDIRGNSGYLTERENTVLDYIIRKEDFTELHIAISKLSERNKAIVQMVYIQDMPLKDVAKVIGVSSSYMSRLVKKILSELQEILEYCETKRGI